MAATSIFAASATYSAVVVDKVDGQILYASGGDQRFNQHSHNLREINAAFRGEEQIPSLDVAELIFAGLTLPTADGSAGQVLTTDGAGNLSWGAGGGGSGYATIESNGTPVTPQRSIMNFSAEFTAADDAVDTTDIGLAAILNPHAFWSTVTATYPLIVNKDNVTAAANKLQDWQRQTTSYLSLELDVADNATFIVPINKALRLTTPAKSDAAQAELEIDRNKGAGSDFMIKLRRLGVVLGTIGLNAAGELSLGTSGFTAGISSTTLSAPAISTVSGLLTAVAKASVQSNDANPNGITYPLDLSHGASGVPAGEGGGVGYTFASKNTAGSYPIMAYHAAIYRSPTNGAEYAYQRLQGLRNGAMVDLAHFVNDAGNKSGTLRLDGIADNHGSAYAYVLENSTASSGGTPNQYSPAWILRAHAQDAIPVDNTLDWSVQVVTVGGTTPPKYDYVLRSGIGFVYTERARFTSAGRLGVGTTGDPGAYLHVKTTSAALGDFAALIDKNVGAGANNKLLDVQVSSSSILYVEADASNNTWISSTGTKQVLIAVGGTAVTAATSSQFQVLKTLSMSNNLISGCGNVTPSHDSEVIARDFGSSALNWRSIYARYLRRASGAVAIELGTSGEIGVYAQTPVARPTVTGARNDPEAALASFLTAMESIGWIVDSSTAT